MEETELKEKALGLEDPDTLGKMNTPNLMRHNCLSKTLMCGIENNSVRW